MAVFSKTPSIATTGDYDGVGEVLPAGEEGRMHGRRVAVVMGEFAFLAGSAAPELVLGPRYAGLRWSM
ncbi:hypothetical protein WME95_12565 [Sorangium sp. So ce327]|jgi:hypothetical protein|uniref:hypothetical protein n=1 Tax=Sorangium sp. So ce327 TaxID=3133301 RepID=UPI003F61A534